MEIIHNELHRKVFADSWQYNDNILKAYCVWINITYLPTGSKYTESTHTTAYTEKEACENAKAYFENRFTDNKRQIISASCVATYPKNK